MRRRYQREAFLLLAVFGIAVAIVLYFLFLAPSADSLVTKPLAYDKDYNPEVYKVVETQVIKDLDYKNSTANLYRKDGNFYEFSLGPIDNSGGGIEVIAYKDPSGHFKKVWDGQDAPDCYSIEKYKVPVTLAPYCVAAVTIDRSNPVRSFFSLFAF